MTGKTLEKVGNETIFKSYNLTVSRFIILHTISDQDGCVMKMSVLQKTLGVSRANTTERINILERDGFVSRKVGEDKRTQDISLTSGGKKIVQKMLRRNVSTLREIYADFSQEEIVRNSVFLKKILEKLNSYEERDVR
jgi:DNA-binding MarR family transcriptional regulator